MLYIYIKIFDVTRSFEKSLKLNQALAKRTNTLAQILCSAKPLRNKFYSLGPPGPDNFFFFFL